MSDEEDDELFDLIHQCNASSLGVRRSSEHIPSATMSFGDPTCGACLRLQLQGGCEQHRKRTVVDTETLPAAPFLPRSATKLAKAEVIEETEDTSSNDRPPLKFGKPKRKKAK